jgi:hypothetical protein
MGGEAKRRGTRDERVAAAIARNEAARIAYEAERDRLEAIRNEKVAAEWAKRSPEERQRLLDRAKDDVSNFVLLEETVGSDMAHLITNIMSDANGIRPRFIKPPRPL